MPTIEPLLQCKFNQAAFWWPPKVLSGNGLSKKLRARGKENGTVWHGIWQHLRPVVVGPTSNGLPRHVTMPVPGPMRLAGLLRVNSVRRAPECVLRGKPRDV